MDSAQAQDSFSYFISEKNAIVVVCFIGAIKRGAVDLLEQCRKELSAKEIKFAAFSFRDVSPQVERPALPILTKIQKELRDRGAELRLSGIHPDLKKEWVEKAIIRQHELADNLTEAIQNFSQIIALKRVA